MLLQDGTGSCELLSTVNGENVVVANYSGNEDYRDASSLPFVITVYVGPKADVIFDDGFEPLSSAGVR